MGQAMYRTGERPGAPLAVSTAGLTKRFGDRTVVEDVALAIPAGSVCGFVGPNGAGKTTTIRMLLGLVRPTSGNGMILGGSLAEPATYLRKVGALIEAPAFYPQLSGRENLKVLARLGQLPLAAVDPVLERSGLLARAGDRYRSYSLGMKQRLGIAAAMLAGPELLILDEPTNGLDPAGIVEMWRSWPRTAAASRRARGSPGPALATCSASSATSRSPRSAIACWGWRSASSSGQRCSRSSSASPG
jgi:ABC-2 type transport system ATP-binding protein